MTSLARRRGPPSGFGVLVLEKPDGTRLPLSQGQVVAMVLEEVMTLGHYVVGLATPLQELRAFMARNGVEL